MQLNKKKKKQGVRSIKLGDKKRNSKTFGDLISQIEEEEDKKNVKEKIVSFSNFNLG